ncbi:MAG: N-acetylneuraminate synthase family protein [Candidatus Hermodarchaeota archaeon]
MKKVKLKELINAKGKNYFILAETAFSHEGSVAYLKQQIDAAIKGKADGVKFQILLDIEDSYTKNTEIFKNFNKWQISKASWLSGIEYAKSKNLEVIVLPIDMKSLDFALENLDTIDAIEIHSISFNQVPYIEKITQSKTVIILGIGGRTLEDIDFIMKELEGVKANTIFMFGFQSFPTDYEKINLSKLWSLKERYNNTLGYADHTSFSEIMVGNEIVKFAYICGARLFEKHLVLEKGKQRIDYEAAVEYHDLIELRKELDSVIKILGDNNLSKLNDVELKYKNREKQLMANEDLKAGDTLKGESIAYKVTTEKSDYEQKDYKDLLNKKLKKNIDKNNVFKRFHIDG